MKILFLLGALSWASVISESDPLPTAFPGTVSCAGTSISLDSGSLYVDCTNNRVGIGSTSPAKTLDVAGTFYGIKTEQTAATDGTVYFNYVSSVSTSPASSAEITSGRFEYNWYKGDNATFIGNALEGVARSRAADEAATLRGVYGRFYIDPDATANATLRTGVGGEFSARASYSGGTELTAESGTAFVGARIWMAPYFTAASTSNINNFHGLWIYNEHTTVPVTNGIFISDAGGGYTNDITLQSGEILRNSTNDSVSIVDDGGGVTATFDTANGRVGIGSASPSVALDVVGAATISGAVIQKGAVNLGDAYADDVQAIGQFTVPVMSSTTMSTTSPTRVGQLAVNTTALNLCISSGTGAGAWVLVSTPTAAGY